MGFATYRRSKYLSLTCNLRKILNGCWWLFANKTERISVIKAFDGPGDKRISIVVK